MNEIRETAATTGSIVLVQIYAGIVITMIVISVRKIIENFKKNKKK